MAVSRYKGGINIASRSHAGFPRWLLLSVAIHIILAVLIILSPTPSRKLFYTPVYEVELLPIPEAAEPEKLPQEQDVRPPKKPVKQKISAKKKKASIISKTRKDEAGYDEAVAKLREKVATEDAVEKIRKKVKGNKEAVSDSAVKIADRAPKKVYHYEELDKELRAYFEKVSRIIRDAWFLPEGLRDKGYKTTLSIHVRRDGSIESLWIESGSGNRLYNDSTLRAINKVNPLPPLPKGWKEGSIDLGLRF